MERNQLKKLVLLGGGGHCKSVIDSLLYSKDFDEIVITDSEIPVGTKVLDVEVVGTDDVLTDLRKNGFEYAFVTVGCIGESKIRERLYEKISRLEFNIPIIIDKTAVVSETAVIGAGTFIGKRAVVNADAVIGKMAIINTGVIVEHECTVGDFSHIAVGAVLCGDVHVGDMTLIGANTTVIQGMEIGDNVVIGAGSTVLRYVKDDEISYGLVKFVGGVTSNILNNFLFVTPFDMEVAR